MKITSIVSTRRGGFDHQDTGKIPGGSISRSNIYQTTIFNIENIIIMNHIYYKYYLNKRRFACLRCGLADTLCPPEAPYGRLGVNWLIIREISSLNMSILVLKSKSLEKSPNLSIFKILMSNDEVITK